MNNDRYVTRSIIHRLWLLLFAVFALTPVDGLAQTLTFVDFIKDGVDGADGLDGAQSSAISPDGKHLYVTGTSETALSVFSRNSTTGALTFVEVHRDGQNGVDGLSSPQAVAISPDGNHVYVTASSDNSVAVFSRNSTTGALTFVEVHKDGQNGVDGISFAFDVTVSPDGNHVYAGGAGDDAIAVFSRNSTTGALTFVEFEKDGVNGVDGLDNIITIRVAPDGNHVYIAGNVDDMLAIFSRDSTTGELTFVGVAQDGVDNANGLDGIWATAVSPDNKHIYVASTIDRALTVFSRNTTTGAVTFVEEHRDGISGVDGLNAFQNIILDDDGSHVYVTSSGDRSIAVFSRDSTTGALTFVEVHKDGENSVDGLNGARGPAISPDNKHIYVASSTDDAVAVFQVSFPQAISVTPTSIDFGEVDAGSSSVDQVKIANNGGADLTVSQVDITGANADLFTVAQAGNAPIGPFTINAGDTLTLDVTYAPTAEGTHAATIEIDSDDPDNAQVTVSLDGSSVERTLSFVEFKKDGVDGVDGLNGAQGITVSPDGKHVYAVGDADNAVAVFSRNETTGALTFVEVQKDGQNGVDGLAGVSDIVISPDGNHLYATGFTESAVAVFSRNSTTGALTFVEVQKDGQNGVDGLLNAIFLDISPDGNHLYVAGGGENALAVFSRNSTTGALTFVEFHQDDQNGVDGLGQIRILRVSTDGGHVYAAGRIDGAIAIFSRNSTTGALTFDSTVGQSFVSNLAVSPNAEQVYAGSNVQNNLVVYTRNSTTGALTILETHTDGSGGVDGLDGIATIAVSPNGKLVFAAGRDDDAIAVFTRNTTTGALTFVEIRQDGDSGVDGLDGILDVVASPDNKNVYAAAVTDDAVAVFQAAVTPEPNISVTPASLDHGQVVRGQTDVKQVKIANSGDADLNVSQVDITGANADLFTVAQAGSAPIGPFTVNPGDTLTLEVTYAPNDTGAHAATLEIDSDDPDNAQATVSLDGVGLGIPDISVTPASLDHGQVVRGQTDAKQVKIANSGDADLNVSQVDITGANADLFTVAQAGSAPIGPFTINAGDTLTLEVTYAPNDTGAHAATLEIDSDDPDNAQATVSLDGVGLGIPDVSVTPSTVDFGGIDTNDSDVKQVKVANSGDADLTVSQIDITGADATFFSVAQAGNAPIGPFTISPGDTLTLEVTYTPTAAAAHTADLTIDSNDPDNAQVAVALSGTGLAPAISVSTTAVNFGDITLETTSGTETVTITNSGTLDLKVNLIEITGADARFFQISQIGLAPLGPFTVKPGNDIDIQLIYKPRAGGPNKAGLSIASNDDGDPLVEVSLTGKGVGGDPTTTVVDLGNIDLDTPIGTTNDGVTMFIVDAGNDRIITKPLDDSSPAAVFNLGGGITLLEPTGIVLDGNTLYIGDSGNDRIITVSKTGGDASVLGLGGFTIATPMGMAVNSGVLYVADSGLDPDNDDTSGSKVMKVSIPAGGDAAELPLGNSITLDGPLGLDIDTGDGVLFISDAGNNRIVKVSIPNGGDAEVVPFGGGVADVTPGGIKVDGTGKLFISDLGGDPTDDTEQDGGLIRMSKQGGDAEELDLGGLDYKGGDVMLVGGKPFVTDQKSNRVVQLDKVETRGNTPVMTVSPLAVDFGEVTPGQTGGPLNVTIANNGSGTLNIDLIEVIGPDARFFEVVQVGLAPVGPLTVPPNEEITVNLNFSPDAGGPHEAKLSIAGNDAADPLVEVKLTGKGAGGDPTATVVDLGGLDLDTPIGTTNDGTTMFIVDSGNDRIITRPLDDSNPAVVFNLGGGITLLEPTGIVLNGNTLYIGDSGNDRIITVSKTGGDASVLGLGGFTIATPMGMAVDAGVLYVSDTGLDPDNDDTSGSKVMKVSIPAGGDAAELPLGNGINLDGPLGLDIDAGDGVLFISDAGNNRIVKVSIPNGGDAEVVPFGGGVADVTPGGIKVDGAGKLFISDLGGDPTDDTEDNGGLIRMSKTGGDAEELDLGGLDYKGGDITLVGGKPFVTDQKSNRVVQLDKVETRGNTPVMAVSPQSVTFGEVTLGQTGGPLKVTIANNGSGALNIDLIEVIGPDARFFEVVQVGLAPVGPLTVPANDEITVSLNFSPEARGPHEAKLSISGNDAEDPLVEVKLTGKGVGGDPTSSVVDLGGLDLDTPIGTTNDGVTMFIVDAGNDRIITRPLDDSSPAAVFNLGGGITLLEPTGIVLDGNTLYIGDSGNDRIVTVSKTGGDASVLGLGGFTIATPMGMAVNNGVLYVADSGLDPDNDNTSGSKIMKVSIPAGGDAAELPLGNGITLDGPLGLDIDAGDGVLFISDAGNNRIVKVSIPNGGDAEVVPFGGGVAGVTPGGIKVDDNGKLFISDLGGDPTDDTEDNGGLIRMSKQGGDAEELDLGGLDYKGGDITLVGGKPFVTDQKSNRVVQLDKVQTQSDAPAIAVSPQSVSFGDVTLEETGGPLKVTIANNGTGTLNIDLIEVIGPDARFFEVVQVGLAPVGPFTVPANDEIIVSLNFSPESRGPHEAKLSIASNDASDPLVEVKLTGKGIGGDPTSSVVDLDGLDLDTPVGTTNDGITMFIVDAGNDRIITKPLDDSSPATVFNLGGGITLLEPTGIVLDGNTLYIGDSGNDRIIQVSKTGGDASVLGLGGFTIATPMGMAVDAGVLYVSDTGLDPDNDDTSGSKVMKVSIPAGGDAAELPLGNSITLDGPLGLDIDAGDGVLFISDAGNNRIVKVSIPNGGDAEVVPFGGGVADVTPGGIKVDDNGKLFISDLGGDPTDDTEKDGGLIRMSKQGGDAEELDLGGLDYKGGDITLVGGKPFVTDQKSNRVVQLDKVQPDTPDPAIAVTPQAVDFGEVTLEQTGGPLKVTITSAGNADLKIDLIEVIGPDARFFEIVQVGLAPVGPFTVEPGNDITVSLSFTPEARGPHNAKLSIASNDAGDPLVEVKLTGKGIGGDPATTVVDMGNIELDTPIGTTNDGTTLFIVDAGNDRVITRPLDDSAPAQELPLGNSITLLEPTGIVLDGNTLYIGDSGNDRIVTVSKTGGDASVLGLGGFTISTPMGMAVDSGVLYVADTGLDPQNDDNSGSKIMKVSIPAGGDAAELPLGNGITLDGPLGIDIDTGELFISDAGNNRIVKVSIPNGGDASIVDFGPMVDNPTPGGIKSDDNGKLFISDFGGDPADDTEDNGNLIRMSKTGGDAENLDLGGLDYKGGDVTLVNGKPLITDQESDRVVQFDKVQTQNVAPAIAVSPQSVDFSEVTLEQTGGPLKVTVANNGSGELRIDLIEVIGPDARFFEIAQVGLAPVGPFTVPPNDEITISLNFSPEARGPHTAKLSIASNDASDPLVEVPLTGKGIGGDPATTVVDMGNIELDTPIGTTNDGTTLFIVDAGNDRVITRPLDDSAPAQELPLGNSITLLEPTGIVLDGNTLYIGDSGNDRIVTVSKTGGDASVLGLGGFTIATPMGMAVDGGILYVSDTGLDPQNDDNSGSKIMKVSIPAGGNAAELPLGNSITLDGPLGIDIDAGELFISDAGNNRIVKVSIPNGGDASIVDFGPMVDNPTPGGIKSDDNGKLFISDLGGDPADDTEKDGSLIRMSKTGGDAEEVDLGGLDYKGGDVTLVDGKPLVTDQKSNRVVKFDKVETQSDEPAIAVSPLSVDFGDVTLDQTGGPLTVTITNDGDADLTISLLEIIGPDARFFEIVQVGLAPVGPFTVKPDKAITVSLSFTPEAGGPHDAKLSIASNDAGDPLVEIKLTGKGVGGDPTTTVVDLGNIELDTPIGTTNDGTTLFIVDAGNDRVITRPLDDDNAPTTVLNLGGGITLFEPTGIVLDGNTLYIGDSGNDRIIKVSKTGGDASVLGLGGFIIATPMGMAVDGGILYVSDTGLDPQNDDNSGSKIMKVSIPAGGDAAELPLGNSITLDGPLGIDIDAGELFISDAGNNRIVKVSIPNGGDASVVDFGPMVDNPTPGGLKSDDNGKLFISDLGGDPADDTDDKGNLIRMSKTGGDAENLDLGGLDYKGGDVTLVNGEPFVTDQKSNRVVKLDKVQTETQAPAIRVSPKSVAFSEVSLRQTGGPLNVTVTNDGNTDLTVSLAEITGPDASFFAFTADGSASSGPFTVTPGSDLTLAVSYTPRAGGPHRATLSIASDDADDPLVEIALNGKGIGGDPATTVVDFGNIELDTPIGMTNDGVTLFVADAGNDRIVIKPLAGNSDDAQVLPLGNNITLFAPTGLVLDGNTLYIGDSGNDRIVKVSKTGGDASVLGLGGFTIATPMGMAIDNGTLYIADSGNDPINDDFTGSRIMKVSIPAGGDAAELPLGGGITLSGSLGLDIENGALFISDADNNRVVKVSIPNGGDAAEVPFEESPSAAPLLAVGEKVPAGLKGDGQGTLFFSDLGGDPTDDTEDSGALFQMSATGGDAEALDLGGLKYSGGDVTLVNGKPFIADQNGNRIVQLQKVLTASSVGVAVTIDTVFVGPDATGPELAITLRNTSGGPVAALQFSVAFSAGANVTLSANPQEVLDFSMLPSGFDANTTSSGDTVDVVITSSSAALIPDGATVTLAKVNYTVSSLDPPGSLPAAQLLGTVKTVLIADDAFLVVSDELARRINNVALESGEIQVGISGDVSLDGQHDVRDFVHLIAEIVQRTGFQLPDSGSVGFHIRDANLDRAAPNNIADAVGIINQILGRPIVTKPTASGPVAVSLDAPQVLESGIVVPVLVSGAGIAGLQAVFTFDPERMTVENPILPGSGEGVLVDSQIEDGTLRMVVLSTTGGSLKTEGALLHIPVTLTGDEAAELTLSQLTAASPQAQVVAVEVTAETQQVARDLGIPTSFALYDARPNPFNPTTTIAYDVPQQAHISLIVYNILGQEVIRLVDEVKAPGRYEVVWSARNRKDRSVASGIYLYRVASSTGFSASKRMVLLK